MLRRVRFQVHRWSPGREPGFVDGTHEELVADDVAQVRAFPRTTAQEGVHARHGLDATREAGSEIVRILGRPQRVLDDGLHAGERVLDAVIELVDQQLLRFARLHVR